MTGALFLLGGGLMQLPAIRAAKELGLECHIADGNEHCIGRRSADRFYHVDLRDREGLVDAARTIPELRGVFTAGTDFSRSVAYVADHLGLPGIPEAVAIRATDKGVMRRCLQEAGVNVPQFCVVTDRLTDPPFPFPVVVKPADNMGARGVTLVNHADDFQKAIENAQRLSLTDTAIVEELISGQEYSLDAVVVNGTVYVTGIGTRHIFFRPHFVELGHTIPAVLSPSAEHALVHEFERAIKALGITSGGAKGDIFLKKNEGDGYTVTIGEVAARLSGGFMSGWTYPLATGVPLTRIGIEIAVGNVPDTTSLRPVLNKTAAERALISAPGTVESINIPDDLHLDVAEVFVHPKPGDTVAPPQNNVEKVANVIVVSESPAQADAVAADTLDRITVDLSPGNPVTDRFFFHDGWNNTYKMFAVCDGAIEAFLHSSVIPSDVITRHCAKQPADDLLMVAPLQHNGAGSIALLRNQISIHPDELLRRLVDERVIRFDSAADRGITVLFWRSFLAGGRQGVRYLCNTINHERGRI